MNGMRERIRAIRKDQPNLDTKPTLILIERFLRLITSTIYLIVVPPFVEFGAQQV